MQEPKLEDVCWINGLANALSAAIRQVGRPAGPADPAGRQIRQARSPRRSRQAGRLKMLADPAGPAALTCRQAGRVKIAAEPADPAGLCLPALLRRSGKAAGARQPTVCRAKTRQGPGRPAERFPRLGSSAAPAASRWRQTRQGPRLTRGRPSLSWTNRPF